jgi:hypothetical protein
MAIFVISSDLEGRTEASRFLADMGRATKKLQS